MLLPFIIQNLPAPPPVVELPDHPVSARSSELLGTDIDMFTDFPLNPQTTAGGFRNLGNAIARRLITDRGQLSYAEDYGYNVRALLNAGLDRSALLAQAGIISSEIEKDDRVLSVSVALDYNDATSSLTIDAKILSDDGPFTLIIGISSLGLSDLAIEVS